MPSVILLDGDGYYLATLILPKTDFIKMQAEFMGEMSNGLRPLQRHWNIKGGFACRLRPLV